MLNNCKADQKTITTDAAEKSPIEDQPNRKSKSIFEVDEIKIEEVSIDGICGVY